MWSVTKRKDPSKTKGILMEYCDRDLYDVISSQEYPLTNSSFVDLCQLSLRISRAVAMMHELKEPLCHLDLKPGNILIQGRLAPKITDFGLAKKSGSSFSGPRGTLPYMAPEQFDVNVDSVSPIMDAWSLGAMLTEMFYGKEANLFRTNSDVAYVESHFQDSEKYAGFFTIFKEIGQKMTCQLCLYPSVDEVLKGLLNISTEDRWTARQAVDSLERILNRPIPVSSNIPIGSILG
jgi:serine/threonine protein kinase